MQPVAQKLALPAVYGKVKSTLPWDEVRERLEQADRYWLVTTRPSGTAHVVPVDGLWLDDRWFYGGSPQTQHHRNLERNPQAVVHLDDTMQVVIVEGSMERLIPDAETASRLAAASNGKYGYGQTPETYTAGVWALHPERARAWSAFMSDATRFMFG